MAYLTKKSGKASCVGILNADGANEAFKSTLELAKEAANEYKDVRENVSRILMAMSPEEKNIAMARFPGHISDSINVQRNRLRKQTLFWRKKA